MAEIVKQFLTVQNFDNWTDEKKDDVNNKGQIVFVPGETRSDKVDVNAIYAHGNTFGDGALSNKTVLTEGFRVEGGPLSELLKDKGITEITEGTNLQDLLKSLFCVTLWSKNIIVTNPKVTVTNVAPKITGVTNNSLYEVGTKLSVEVALQPMKVNNTPAKISGFEYGLSYGGVKYEDATERIKNNDIIYTADSPYVGTYSYCVGPTDGPNYNMSNTVTFQSMPDDQLQVTNGTRLVEVTTYLGSNKFTAISTYSKGLTYSNSGISNTYDLSNLGDIGDYSYNINKLDQYTVNRDETDKETTVNWTGVYPILFNGTKYTDSNSDGVEIDTTSVAASDTLIKSNELFVGSKSLFVKFPKQDANSWKIAIPEYYSGTTISAKAFDGLVTKQYSIDVTFSKTDKTGIASCGTDGVTQYYYRIWEATGTSGANGVQLTINLK